MTKKPGITPGLAFYCDVSVCYAFRVYYYLVSIIILPPGRDTGSR